MSTQVHVRNSPLTGTPRVEAFDDFHVAADARPLSHSQPAIAWQLGREAQDRVRSFMQPTAIAHSAEQLYSVAAQGTIDLVIADPALDGCTDTLIRLCAEVPSVLLVSYTTLTASVLPSILRLSAHGINEFVLLRYDDTRLRFAEIAERSLAHPAIKLVVGALNARLLDGPPSLHEAIARLFAAPRWFRAVDDLAAASQLTRRSLYRSLDRAGLAPPGDLLAAARVLRASVLLQRGTVSVRDVSRSLGYSKPEQLSDQVRRFTGMSARDVRQRLNGVETARLIAGILTTIRE